MKILHIITSLADGGAEGVLYRLAAHDSLDTHHVVCLTGEGKYGPLLRRADIAVSTLDMPRGHPTFRGLIGLWRVMRSWRAEVIQTWMYHADLLGGLAGRLAGLPVVWGIRNTTLDAGRSSRATIRVAKLCARLSRWLPARIVACAQAAVRVHAALGYDAKRMVVIPNGYDLSRFRPDPAARQRLRAQWGVADDEPVLGMVARRDPQKDHVNLIQALARLQACVREFRVVLVGTGITTDNRELVQALDEAGLSRRTQLLGPQPDVPAVMAALDVHVLSSAYGEAFPNVLAEAMACGTPCVATDVGDAALIVGDTGWLVPPGDAEALADALAAAIDAWRAQADWRLRQQRARARIHDEFGLDAMVARYRAVWAEVAVEHGTDGGTSSCAD